MLSFWKVFGSFFSFFIEKNKKKERPWTIQKNIQSKIKNTHTYLRLRLCEVFIRTKKKIEEQNQTIKSHLYTLKTI